MDMADITYQDKEVTMDNLNKQLCFPFLIFLALVYSTLKNWAYQLTKGVMTAIHGCDGNGTVCGKHISDIPGPNSLPIFGTTLTSPQGRMSDLHRANNARMEKYGPLIKEEHLGGFPMIHVLDADMIEVALKAVGTIRPGFEMLVFYRQSRPDLYDHIGLTNSQGSDWDQMHSIVGPAFSNPSFLKRMAQGMDGMSLDFISLINNELSSRGSNTIDDFIPLLRKLVTEVNMYHVFGKRMGYLVPVLGNEGEQKTTIRQKLDMFLNANDKFWDMLQENMYGFPWWKYWNTKSYLENVQYENVILKIVDEFIQESKEYSTIHEDRKDESVGILSKILGADISYKTARLLTMEAILGGIDAITMSTTLMLGLLGTHQGAAEKLFQEVRSNLLPFKDSPLDVDKLVQLPYLKAFVMEAYRLASITPNLMRLTEKECNLGGYFLPKYTLVILQWAWTACQDSNFYKAKDFLPERWIYDEDGKPRFEPHRRNLVFPFGYSKRMCPGNKIARQHHLQFLARIVRNFKVKRTSPLETKYVWLITPEQPCSFTFEARED